MNCQLCGGYVEWKGPITALTHTECASCGSVDCQEEEFELAHDEPSELGFTEREIERGDYLADETKDREMEERWDA